MAAAAASSLAAVGRRLLGEIEETSLEDVLERIRKEASARAQRSAAAAPTAAAAAQHGGQYGGPHAAIGSPVKSATPSAGPRLPSFPVPALQHLVASHFRATRGPEVVVGGSRPLALVYLLVATLVAAPRRQAVVVVDSEARFEVRRLLGVCPAVRDQGDDDYLSLSSSPVSERDLQHVHVFRVDPRWRAPLADLVAAAEQRVLYGAQRRRDRPWWGTVVIGGAGGAGGSGGSGGDGVPSVATGLRQGSSAALVTGYYGWLRVDALGKDPVWVRQERQRRLLALFEGMDLKQDGEEECAAEGGGEQEEATRVLRENGAEPVAWLASSPWGSFAFRLPKASEAGREAGNPSLV